MRVSPLEEGISKLVKEFRLPVGFSKRVHEESVLLPQEILADELSKRVDLRNQVTVTIDGENAKDFDDAVAVEALPNGRFVLRVSIADVGYYVRPGSAIDQEAYRRGTSSYFPDRVLPMLPERLSNDLCSLVPHQDRLTFTAEMEFDAEGRRVRSHFYRSVIRSANRLTYTEVRKILVDRDPETLERYRKIVPDLERMGALAEKIQAVRTKRGSLDFDLPEPLIEIDFQEAGQPRSGVEGEASRALPVEGATRAPMITTIVKSERNKAHRLIEEFMIAANEAVAEFITEQGRPMVYRVHGEPDPEKVKDFAVMLHNLGYRFHLKRKLQPTIFAEIIEAVRGQPVERLVNTVLLRTMKQAVYDTRNVGHFGLASRCYTHFTSPIRRYPDLIVHRILARVVGVESPCPGAGGTTGPLHQIASHCSESERNSMKAEWASRDLAAALFMKDKIGETYEGIIAGVTRFGFFVELLTYFVQGLVPVKELKDDYYVYYEKSHLLVGKRHKRKYQVGTPVRVKVRGVNLDKRWVDFCLDHPL